MTDAHQLSGSVHFMAPAEPGAVLHIRLEDVTHTDGVAEIVAEQVHTLEAPLQEGAEMAFSLAVPVLDPRHRYGVRVHVDTTGSGNVTEGDLVSTQAYPVLTFGQPDHVRVDVHGV